jgi:hypothetical protein
MATISVDTYLDGGTARTSGEQWNINTCNLTIRTDTRWHANAPASMTGTIGNIFLSAGGGIKIDGTKVRWLPFNSGGGTVPAIGTTITQPISGGSGYLLGVWSSLTAAPTAVGAAMPSTGWIKFREVNTPGIFQATTLTGIICNATGPDVTGWIEVIFQQSTFLYGSFTGGGANWQGDWFYLDSTTGSTGQTIQIPTNGGGAGTVISAVQIETSPGSSVYEWYLAVPTANWLASTIAVDARAKLFESVGGGLIRFGATSTGTVIGYTPAAGCKVRVPNIFVRYAGSGTGATTILPGTGYSNRPGFASGQAKFICDKVDLTGWNLYAGQPNGLSTFTITNSVYDGNLVGVQFTINIDNIGVGQVVATTLGLQLTNCNGYIRNSKISSRATHTLTSCDSLEITNTKFTCISTTGSTFTLTSCSNSEITNIQTIGHPISLVSCNNVNIHGHDYIHQLLGPTNAAFSPTAAISIDKSSNILHENLTFGNYGAFANCQPYTLIYAFTGNTGNIVVRNAGTMASPLSFGANATFASNGLTNISTSYNTGITMKRMFFTDVLRGAPYSFGTGTSNLIIENNYLPGNTISITSSNKTLVKGLRVSSVQAGTGASYDAPFFDIFTSDTAGRWQFIIGSKPSSSSSYGYSYAFTTAVGTGWEAGTLSYKTIGDWIEIETPYWVLGHTAFANVALSGGSSGTATYAINTGSGYGAYKTLTLANLLTETLNPAGTKMKVKYVATAAGGGSNLIISTVSTLAAQTAALYPLSTSTLAFTGLAVGSEVRCYTGTDPATAVEIGGVESTAGSTFSFTQSSGGTAGYITILAMGYQPVRFNYTYKSTDDSILIQPVVDRNYYNPV